MKLVNSTVAKNICKLAAIRRGVSVEQAEWFAHALVETSLMGIDTHGIRLLTTYLRELDEGRSNPLPSFKIINQKGGAVALDADSALGTVAGTYAAHLACDLASEYGIGAVSVRNSNHFGAASTYGKVIANKGMLGLVTTSAAARMAPFNGVAAMFGTNPICFAAPSTNGKHYLLDMATSQISYSQIKYYRKNNKPLPSGWALSASGEFTSDPAQVVSLAPLGGYKGQGLAMMVQILSCLLSTMPLDHELEHFDTGSFVNGRNIGHFLIAIDISAFTDLDQFQNAVSELMKVVKNSPARSGQQIFVAGDLQEISRIKRLKEGIPLNEEEFNALLKEGQKLGIDMPSESLSISESPL